MASICTLDYDAEDRPYGHLTPGGCSGFDSTMARGLLAQPQIRQPNAAEAMRWSKAHPLSSLTPRTSDTRQQLGVFHYIGRKPKRQPQQDWSCEVAQALFQNGPTSWVVLGGLGDGRHQRRTRGPAVKYRPELGERHSGPSKPGRLGKGRLR